MTDETERIFALSELKQGKAALKQHFLENYKNVSQDFSYEPHAETASSTSNSPQKTSQRRRGRASKAATSGTELDQYFAVMGLGVQSWEVDLLAWWYAHCEQFPMLYLMARDVLSIPGEFY
jgi:hypothetical protein